MKLFKSAVLVLGVVLLLAGNAVMAQYEEDVLPQQGDISIGAVLSGIFGNVGIGSGLSFSDIEGSRSTVVTFAGDYLFTNEFAFGLELGFSDEKPKGEDSIRTTILGARLTYFLRPPTGVTLPYVRVGFVSIDPDEGDTATGFTAGGGVQLFLTPAAAVDLGLTYVNLRNGDTVDGFNFKIGLTFWLR